MDKTIRVWKLAQDHTTPESVTILEGHNSSVNCFAVSPGSNIVVSGAADGTLRTWHFSLTEGRVDVKHIQIINLSPKYFPLTLALHALGSGSSQNLVLAAAGTRNTIQLFVSDNGARFSHQTYLTGHDGWVRSLAFCQEGKFPFGDLLLASASQDKYIRLWRISKDQSTTTQQQPSIVEAFEQTLSNRSYKIKAPAAIYAVTFEALLLGHEDWVFTVSWCLRQDNLRLLSASEDNSLSIWEREDASGLWISTTRLGESSSLKGSTTATGSAGGFWIGLWSPTGMQLASLGKTGSWRLWEYDQSRKRWQSCIGISGHTQPVMDVVWSKNGSYLLSAGSDQTTRLHGEWKRGQGCSWHELARPQIHGYNLICIDSIKESQFVSGSEEKLLRVFDEPKATARLLETLSGIESEEHDALPDTADIPVLGLSNKAVNSETNVKPSGDDDNNNNDDAEGLDEYSVLDKEITSFAKSTAVSEKPLSEDRLARHTLWPEKEKLYGHGHEISAVAVSPRGDVIATACKASSQDHAVIRLYDAKSWREIKPSLMAHSLTVASLRFSHSGEFLLSVGRDRMWALWEARNEPDGCGQSQPTTPYTLKCTNAKGHSRMILKADWAPVTVSAGNVFATAGRDKCAKIWLMKESNIVDCVSTIQETAAVTAVAIAPRPVGSYMMMALGAETGRVSLHLINHAEWSHSYTRELDFLYVIPLLQAPVMCSNASSLQPSKSVTQLAWRPEKARIDEAEWSDGTDKNIFQLAIASEDSSLRLLTVVCDIQPQSEES